MCHGHLANALGDRSDHPHQARFHDPAHRGLVVDHLLAQRKAYGGDVCLHHLGPQRRSAQRRQQELPMPLDLRLYEVGCVLCLLFANAICLDLTHMTTVGLIIRAGLTLSIALSGHSRNFSLNLTEAQPGL